MRKGASLAIVFAVLGILSAFFLHVGTPAQDRGIRQQTTQNTSYTMDYTRIERVLFHPRNTRKTEAPAGAVNIDVPVTADIRLGCRLFTHDNTTPTLIFFHGNGEIVSDYDDIAPYYLKEGLNFLLCDYRGYGWSDGTPRLDSFLADVDAAFVFLRAWLAERDYTGPLFVMGRSLGSACAIDIAARHNEVLSGLIIESGFARSLPLLQVLGLDPAAMGMREEDSFNNGEKIAVVTKPTFILHGQYDQLIPLWQAETLQAASGAKQKELQIIPGADHNSLIAVAGTRYFAAIRAFVEKATGTAPDWRQRRRQFKAAQQQGASPDSDKK